MQSKSQGSERVDRCRIIKLQGICCSACLATSVFVIKQTTKFKLKVRLKRRDPPSSVLVFILGAFQLLINAEDLSERRLDSRSSPVIQRHRSRFLERNNCRKIFESCVPMKCQDPPTFKVIPQFLDSNPTISRRRGTLRSWDLQE